MAALGRRYGKIITNKKHDNEYYVKTELKKPI